MVRHWIYSSLLWLPLGTALAQTAPADTSAADRPVIESIPLETGAASLRSTPSDRLSLTLTLSPDGVTQVYDQRDLALLPGRNTVRIEGVPSQVELTRLRWDLPAERSLIRLHATAEQLQATLFADEAGSRRFGLRYPIPEIDWQIDYQLTFDEDDTANIQRFLTLANHSDQAFANPEVVIKSAHGEWINLRMGGTLAAHSRLKQPLGERMPVSATTQLLVRGRADQLAKRPLRQTVEQRIILNEVDLQWPAGPIEVMRPQPSGQVIMSGQTSLSAPDANAQAVTVIPIERDIAITRTLEGVSSEGTEQVQLNWRLQIHNRESQPVTLLLEEVMDPRWALVEAGGQWSRTGHIHSREIQIEAGSVEEIEISVRGPFIPEDQAAHPR